jgi:hypothetical protein
VGTRTVRLDEDAEVTLARLRRMTGLSITDVFKRGLAALDESARSGSATRKPYEIYRLLNLGEGGYAVAPASEAKSALREVIRRKHPGSEG